MSSCVADPLSHVGILIPVVQGRKREMRIPTENDLTKRILVKLLDFSTKYKSKEEVIAEWTLTAGSRIPTKNFLPPQITDRRLARNRKPASPRGTSW